MSTYRGFPELRLFLLIGAAVVSMLCAACGGDQPLLIGPGTTLEEIPGHYSIVLGRVELQPKATSSRCALGESSCGISVHDAEGNGLFIPYSPPVARGLPGSGRSPFFIIRLPEGSYTISHFQGLGSGPGAIGRQFRVHSGEVVYVGSLLLQVPPDRKGPLRSRVVNDRQAADQVAREVAKDGDVPLVTRLMQ